MTMAQLFDALVADYATNGRRSGATLAFRLAPLREAFGQDKAHDVKAASIKRYTDQRRAAGKAQATINRELAALRRAFTIAGEQERLSAASVPRVKLFAEHNARQGFVSRLPVYLQDYARFAYGSGWRKGEVATLEWSAVDKGTTRVTLRREHSKNGEPRVLPLVGELTEIIVRRRQECTYTTVAGETAESRYIFHRYGDRRLPQGVDRCLRRGRVRETEGAPRRASSGRSQGRARHEGDADLPRSPALRGPQPYGGRR